MTTPEAVNNDAFDKPLAAVLPAVAEPQLQQDFTEQELITLRHQVHAAAAASGLVADPLDDFVIAVHELCTNAVRHGGGHGRLVLRRDGDTLLCDISDHGPGFTAGVPAPAAPPPPDTSGGRGLWLARKLTDTLTVTDGPSGVTATVSVCLPAASTALLAAMPDPHADIAPIDLTAMTTPATRHTPTSNSIAADTDTSRPAADA